MTHLYHYTTADAFYKIVKSGTIWMTNVLYANDGHEMRYALSIATNAIKTRLDSGRLSSDQLNACSEMVSLVSHWWREYEAGRSGCFASSFSRDGNQLEQWRSYCSNGGYAIGLREDELQAAAKKQELQFAECTYDKQSHVGTMERIVDDILSKPAKSGDISSSPTRQLWTRFNNVVGQWKNECYDFERECRIIGDAFQVVRADDSDAEMEDDVDWRKDLDYAPSGSFLRPFIVFDISDLLANMHVFVAPGPTQQLATSSARMFLYSRGFSLGPNFSDLVTPSKMPERAFKR